MNDTTPNTPDTLDRLVAGLEGHYDLTIFGDAAEAFDWLDDMIGSVEGIDKEQSVRLAIGVLAHAVGICYAETRDKVQSLTIPGI